MAFTESNRATRQNISNLAQGLASVKGASADRMQRSRLQKESIVAQQEENRKNRMTDLLKTGGTMIGDYLSKNMLAEKAEDRAAARVDPNSPFAIYESAIMDKEAELEKDIATHSSTLKKEEQEYMYGKGGPLERFNVAAEGRAAETAEGVATTAHERALELGEEQYGFQEKLINLQAKNASKAADVAFGREEDIMNLGAEISSTAADEQAAREDEALRAMYTPGHPYYEYISQQDDYQAMAAKQAELWFMKQISEDPALLAMWMRDNGVDDVNEALEFAPTIFISTKYAEYMQSMATAGGDPSREGFEESILLDLNTDRNVYGDQFVTDVTAALPGYLDKYFKSQPEDVETPGGRGISEFIEAPLSGVEAAATKGDGGVIEGLQGTVALAGNLLTGGIPAAIRSPSGGSTLGQGIQSVLGKTKGQSEEENAAIAELRGIRDALSGDDKKTVNSYINRIGATGTLMPEELQRLIETAKRLGQSTTTRGF